MISIIIPNRGESLLKNTIDNIYASIGVDVEIIIVNDGCDIEPDLPKGVININIPKSRGTSFARHTGIINATNEYIFTCDGHMEFHQQDWGNDICKGLAENPKGLLCCKMRAKSFDSNEISDCYTGAEISMMYTKKSGDKLPFDAKWATNELGEIGCIMGAGYAINKSWYVEGLNAPMRFGVGWGYDEETLSITNWICGGTNILIDTEVVHIFGSPRSNSNYTKSEISNIMVNRLRLTMSLPMDEMLRHKLMSHSKENQAYLSDVNAVEAKISSMTVDILEHREYLKTKGRTIEGYFERFPSRVKPKLTVIIRSPLSQKERRQAIRETWGKDFKDLGIDVAFSMSGINKNINTIRKNDGILSVGTDSHNDLTNRMCRLASYLLGDDSTHFLFIDDDCSVNVKAFMKLDWGNSDAFGFVCGDFISGCAVVYSKKSIQIISNLMTRDDLMIGLLLKSKGIEFKNTEKNSIRPWSERTPEDPKFGDNTVAVQHYVKTPEEIRANHNLLVK